MDWRHVERHRYTFTIWKKVLPSREIKQSLRKECRTWKRVIEITFCQAKYTFTFAVVGNHHHGWRWESGKTQSYPTSRWYLYPAPPVSRQPIWANFPGHTNAPCKLQVTSQWKNPCGKYCTFVSGAHNHFEGIILLHFKLVKVSFSAVSLPNGNINLQSLQSPFRFTESLIFAHERCVGPMSRTGVKVASINSAWTGFYGLGSQINIMGEYINSHD